MTNRSLDRTLCDLATEAVDRYDVIDDAVHYVIRELKKNPPLLKKLSDYILEAAVRATVHDVRHTNRRSIKRKAVANVCRSTMEAAAGFISRVYPTYFLQKWIIFDGRSLGEVWGRELPKLADLARKIAKGETDNALFYDELATRVPSNRKVKSCVSSKEAEEIWTVISQTPMATAAS